MSLEDDIRKLAAAGTTMPKNPLTLYVRKSDRSVFVDISSGAGSYEELLRVFATFESPYYASIYDKAGRLLFEHLTQNAMIEP